MVRYYEIIKEEVISDEEIHHRMTHYFYLDGPNFGYTIENGLVNVKGLCVLNPEYKVNRLPLKFGEVTGGFNCNKNSLKTLEGSPSICGGSFYCDDNLLETLEYSPKIVSGAFTCNGNPLKNLIGMPTRIKESFSFYYTEKLESLEGLEKSYVRNDAYLQWHETFPLLRLIGHVGRASFSPEIEDAYNVEKIMNKWIKSEDSIKKRIFECQYELIKAGYKGNAKW